MFHDLPWPSIIYSVWFLLSPSLFFCLPLFFLCLLSFGSFPEVPQLSIDFQGSVCPFYPSSVVWDSMRFPSILTESPLPPMGFHDLLWPSTLFSGLSLDIPWGSVTFHSWFFHVSSTGPSWLVFLCSCVLSAMQLTGTLAEKGWKCSKYCWAYFHVQQHSHGTVYNLASKRQCH